MTIEEAIAALQGYIDNPLIENKEPFKMAISALEKIPKYRKEARRWKHKWLKSQKSGEWIKIQSGDKDFPESIVCSMCGNENSHLDFNENAEPIGKVFITSKYCPSCGCRMTGGLSKNSQQKLCFSQDLVKERQTGEWNEYYTSQKGNNVFNCKECGHTFVVTQGKDNMNFCPNCGARMFEPQESGKYDRSRLYNKTIG